MKETSGKLNRELKGLSPQKHITVSGEREKEQSPQRLTRRSTRNCTQTNQVSQDDFPNISQENKKKKAEKIQEHKIKKQ